MTGARRISATVLLLLLPAICGCALMATPPATPPKTDTQRYYLTVRVVDYDRDTPLSEVAVQLVPSSCSPGKNRSLVASRGEKIEPSNSQSTGPLGTVVFALSVDLRLSASLKMVIGATFKPENVENCTNTAIIGPTCSCYWNPIKQGDSEYIIVKPALRIVPLVTELSVAPRDSVHATARILNQAPYAVDFSVLATQKIPTAQPLSEGRVEGQMSTDWLVDISPPESGWGFGNQTVNVCCCQIDEEEEWLKTVNATVSFYVPSSQ